MNSDVCMLTLMPLRLSQVSTQSEMTRNTASVVTDDESLDGLVIVDDVQTTQMPGISQCHYTVAVCLD